MSLKRWLPLLGALGLMVMVAGVAGAANNKSKTRTITRACFWVEEKGAPVTRHDVKISRLNRSDVRFCIVGKSGAKGKAGATGATGAQGSPIGACRGSRASAASRACRDAGPERPDG